MNAPKRVIWDLEESEHHEDLNDVLEDNIQGGIAADESGIFFAEEHPLVD